MVSAFRVQMQPIIGLLGKDGRNTGNTISNRRTARFAILTLWVRLMAQLLSEVQIKEQVSQLPGWTLEGKEIRCEKRFTDFVEAIAWVNKLVEPAEAAGHHPDLAVSYNKVTVRLSTHDAGGLTQMDFDLAQVISGL